jgi:predicted RNase H-like nuclease (RuvC/YqgF family)
MTQPNQEIPEARSAANKVRDVLSISTTDFKFDAVFEIITEACREYAKRENAFITKCAFDSVEVMAKENAHLRQQLSALQKENESLRVQASEECDAKHRAFDRVERAESRAEKAEKELDEAREVQNYICCVYCKLKLHRDDVDKLADHILICEKSPLVQLLKDQESFNKNLESELTQLRNDVKPLLGLVQVCSSDGGCRAIKEMEDFLSKHPELKD